MALDRGVFSEGPRSGQQIGDLSPKRIGEGVDRRQRRVPDPALQALQVLSRDTGPVGELLLGQTRDAPRLPEAPRQPAAALIGEPESRLPGHMIEGWFSELPGTTTCKLGAVRQQAGST